MRFDLSDEDWALLEPLLPKSRRSARVDDRKIMNAIFYVLRTGMPWWESATYRRIGCQFFQRALLPLPQYNLHEPRPAATHNRGGSVGEMFLFLSWN
jgi:hypothetical protein